MTITREEVKRYMAMREAGRADTKPFIGKRTGSYGKDLHEKEGVTMTIDDAIEIIRRWGEDDDDVDEGDFSDAIQLGIEALKWRLQIEQEYPSIELPLLPGETIDIV